MTDQQENLRVLTDHINELAARQHTAAAKITGANRMTGGDTASRVLTTHGLVCAPTSAVFSAAETGRKAAGAALFKASAELAEKLTTAAYNYNSTDYMAGKMLDRNM
ncbi:ESX-1 secretion-associated protein [Mycobacterium sp. MFM001]|uniref:ESX-1 secretion-associated protein n=1 Tax=Mycobacterium sp. MFM001 TaxID=2049453 RepID=UPI000DA58442|nr:ESX-1 secretion-associated protein [Mycobacterium sp. MFM001]GBE64071.1 ESX-1 secretion-associated protein [Mycobacterium sp. MFM001]